MFYQLDYFLWGIIILAGAFFIPAIISFVKFIMFIIYVETLPIRKKKCKNNDEKLVKLVEMLVKNGTLENTVTVIDNKTGKKKIINILEYFDSEE